MVIYSHSRLSTFEQCPYRFKLKYIDKIKPEIDASIEAHLGSAVHNTLEWLYNFVKDLPENSDKTPTLDAVIEHYANVWQESYPEKIKIVRDLTPKDYFNKGVQFLVDYYLKHQPFRDGTIECEKKIIIELDEGYKLQGFIDRLVQGIEGHIEIHDYKTANTLPTKEKIEKDRQLALYSIAIKEIYGKDKEVKLIWHYLAHGQKIQSSRTNEQLDKLKKDTLELIKQIESTNTFPTSKSILCDWCEYKTMCYEFGGKIEKPKSKEENIDEEIETKEKSNGLDIW